MSRWNKTTPYPQQRALMYVLAANTAYKHAVYCVSVTNAQNVVSFTCLFCLSLVLVFLSFGKSFLKTMTNIFLEITGWLHFLVSCQYVFRWKLGTQYVHACHRP